MAQSISLSQDQLDYLKSMIPPDFTSVAFYTDEQIGLYKMIGFGAITLGLSEEDYEAGHDSRMEIVAQMTAYQQNAMDARERSERRATRMQDIRPFLDQLDAAGAKYEIEFYDKEIPDDDELGDDTPTPRIGQDIPRVIGDGKQVKITKLLTNATGVETDNFNFVMQEAKGH